MKKRLLWIVLFTSALAVGQNANFKINTRLSGKSKTENYQNLKIVESVEKRLNNIKKDSTLSPQEYKLFFDEILSEVIASKKRISIYDAYILAYDNEIAELEASKVKVMEKIEPTKVTVAEVRDADKKEREIDSKIRALKLKKETVRDVENFNTGYRIKFLSFGKDKSNAYFNIMYSEEGEKLYFVGNSGFNLGDNTGSVYSELVSGNLAVFRLSIGTMVANSSSEGEVEETQDEAFQRLATNGGNTVFKVEYPLVYISDSNNQYIFLGRFLGKAAADFPAFGTKSDDFSGSLSGGLNFYGGVSTANQEIRLYMDFNMNLVSGTDVFRDNLGTERRDFTFGNFSIGLVVMNKLNLSVMVKSFSSEDSLKNKSALIGGSLLF